MTVITREDYRLSTGTDLVSIVALTNMLGGYEKLLGAFMDGQFDQDMMLEVGNRLNIASVCIMLQIINREIKALRSEFERLYAHLSR